MPIGVACCAALVAARNGGTVGFEEPIRAVLAVPEIDRLCPREAPGKTEGLISRRGSELLYGGGQLANCVGDRRVILPHHNDVVGGAVVALFLMVRLMSPAEVPAQKVKLPNVPAVALEDVRPADRQGSERETFGTAVEFVRNAPEAGRIGEAAQAHVSAARLRQL